LLPRLVTAAADDTIELITVGVGLGVGVGVGVGVGDCACAADMTATSTTAIATSRASAPPVPIFRARQSHDEQRMQSIPKGKAPARKNAQIPINRSDLPPVRRKGQSASPQAGRRIRVIVVRLPQPARHHDQVCGTHRKPRRGSCPALELRPPPGTRRCHSVPDRIARSSGRHTAANCRGLRPPAASPIRTPDKSRRPRRQTSSHRCRRGRYP
jgi:hypothetical protein